MACQAQQTPTPSDAKLEDLSTIIAPLFHAGSNPELQQNEPETPTEQYQVPDLPDLAHDIAWLDDWRTIDSITSSDQNSPDPNSGKKIKVETVGVRQVRKTVGCLFCRKIPIAQFLFHTEVA